MAQHASRRGSPPRLRPPATCSNAPSGALPCPTTLQRPDLHTGPLREVRIGSRLSSRASLVGRHPCTTPLSKTNPGSSSQRSLWHRGAVCLAGREGRQGTVRGRRPQGLTKYETEVAGTGGTTKNESDDEIRCTLHLGFYFYWRLEISTFVYLSEGICLTFPRFGSVVSRVIHVESRHSLCFYGFLLLKHM
ncbi:hypothetical protein VPH35_020835 [Triticum aestivum]|uniref:uncharacterized protein n=1 Tax=Triticum aestivum TaxID=4565 RepID=UPI001D0148B2|nr:uncharacterized protein LOC123185256 [Triticum aestivum]